MFRKTGWIFLLLSLIAFDTGCGKKDSPPATPPEGNQAVEKPGTAKEREKAGTLDIDAKGLGKIELPKK